MRLLLDRMAAPPMSANPINSTIIAMTTNPATQSAIDAATRRNSRMFITYIGILIVTALIIALFTWLVWDAGNKVQDAIRVDADARIAEAQSTGASASERAGKLEHNNLILRSTVATLETKAASAQKDVSSLQKAASDAKMAQQKVEIELAKQRERTAAAELALAKVQERMKWRSVSPEQRKRLLEMLKDEAKGNIVVKCSVGDDEAYNFASQFVEILRSSGWSVDGVNQSWFADPPVGAGFLVHKLADSPSYGPPLQKAFIPVGFEFSVSEQERIPVGEIELLIGHKAQGE